MEVVGTTSNEAAAPDGYEADVNVAIVIKAEAKNDAAVEDRVGNSRIDGLITEGSPPSRQSNLDLCPWTVLNARNLVFVQGRAEKDDTRKPCPTSATSATTSNAVVPSLRKGKPVMTMVSEE
jgi:hypothetical protein